MVLVRLFFLLLLVYPSIIYPEVNSHVPEENIYTLLDGDCSKVKKVAELFIETAREGNIDQSLTLKIASFLSQCTLVSSEASDPVQTSGLLEGGEGELWSIKKSINSLQYYVGLYQENINNTSIDKEIGEADNILANFSLQMMSVIFSGEDVEIFNRKKLSPDLPLSKDEQIIYEKINEWAEGRVTESDR